MVVEKLCSVIRAQAAEYICHFDLATATLREDAAEHKGEGSA